MGGGGTTIQAPAAPNYAQSMRETLQAQIDLAPKLYASEQQYQPLYAQLQAQTQGYLGQQALEQAKQLYPQVAQIEAGYSAANRAAELQQLQGALPQYQKAFESLTPGYGQAVAGMGQIAQQATAAAANSPQITNYAADVQGPTSGQYVGQVGQYVPGTQLQGVGTPQEAGFLRGVRGPSQYSGLGQINQGLVSQYVGAMPGMEGITQQAGQIAQQELAAGRGLTEEEQRQAQQAAREAYAARGTALGNQAITAEVLGRSELANQRMQERMQNAAAAQGMIQSAYAPALQQALARQQGMAEYGLSAQGQLFQQQAARENLAQQLQQARYEQGMGRESLLSGAQAQAYQQAMGREQLAGQTQQEAFSQALNRQQADIARAQGETGIQAGQAQLAAGALGQMQAAQAPVLQAFYKQPLLQGAANFAQQSGMGMQQQMGPQFFNPESQTAMGSIYGAFNANTQLAAANAQANAGKQAGIMSGIGSGVSGMALGAGIAL